MKVILLIGLFVLFVAYVQSQACPDLCLLDACKSDISSCMGPHCGDCAFTSCTCTKAEDCKTGQYCQDKVCVEYATEGDTCTPLTYIGKCALKCQPGLVCSGIIDNGQCVQG